jgi:multidrug transporter EmrE-like cation transporter
VFTWLSWWLFKEPLSIKTIVSLLLAVGILGIQILWK